MPFNDRAAMAGRRLTSYMAGVVRGISMRKMRIWMAFLLAVMLAFAPSLADARAGSGSSFGSRGSRTYSAPPATGTSPYGASPMQQSTTVPGSSYGGGSYGGGYGGGYGRSGLGAGLLGGLLGFGLGSALMGHGWGGGYGYGGGMGVLGLLLRLAILFFVVRWLFRRFFGGGASFGGGLFAPRMASGPVAFGGPAPIQLGGPPIAIQPGDYAAFEVLLKNIQAAWSNADINALRSFSSPEMVSYFATQLADNASRGVRNVVSDVHLQKGDLSEAWSENGRDYATVAMNYSMTDATYDQSGRVVDGSPTEHVSATEYWTFLRAPGGHWTLSAIQQGR
jgi:predicted lipid-binding transport protein (Tim44 family)